MKYKTAELDLDDEPDFHGTLGYYVKSRVMNQYSVYLDQDIVEASYYRNVANMMLDATENDMVVFFINSNGGSLSGLQTLIESIKLTDASVLAVLTGSCHSAASILALHCDDIQVLDSANMLCHNVSYTAGGKGSDVLSHVQHISKTSQKLLFETYQHFLSDSEIDDMINGKEIYLDADDIRERLETRQQAYQAENEEPEPVGAPEIQIEPVPKRKRK